MQRKEQIQGAVKSPLDAAKLFFMEAASNLIIFSTIVMAAIAIHWLAVFAEFAGLPAFMVGALKVVEYTLFALDMILFVKLLVVHLLLAFKGGNHD